MIKLVGTSSTASDERMAGAAATQPSVDTQGAASVCSHAPSSISARSTGAPLFVVGAISGFFRAAFTAGGCLAGYHLFGLVGFILGVAAGAFAGLVVIHVSLLLRGISVWRQDILYTAIAGAVVALGTGARSFPGPAVLPGTGPALELAAILLAQPLKDRSQHFLVNHVLLLKLAAEGREPLPWADRRTSTATRPMNSSRQTDFEASLTAFRAARVRSAAAVVILVALIGCGSPRWRTRTRAARCPGPWTAGWRSGASRRCRSGCRSTTRTAAGSRTGWRAGPG